jgi:hypothetical protein
LTLAGFAECVDDLSITNRKFQDGFATYERNTGNPHPLSGSIPLSRRASASEPLTSQNLNLWYGSISVGTPPKSFSGMTFLPDWLESPYDSRHDAVDFDTGSSDFFLFSSTCGANCSGHTFYDPSQSSSAQDLHKPFLLAYGDGSTASGEQFTDVVSVAGLTV